MDKNDDLNSVKRIGTGLSFIIFPLVFIFAFAGHPNMLNLHLLGPEELIHRARGNGLLHFGHALVTLNTALLLVVALHFMKLLIRRSAGKQLNTTTQKDALGISLSTPNLYTQKTYIIQRERLNRGTTAWAGFIGGILAIFGVLMLAADKGALCLTMSALETLPDGDFAQMMPGLLLMFSKCGWLVLLWGLLLLPIGFAIQAVALLKSNAIPRWQSVLFLVGVLFVGTPDGVEIINLSASVLLAFAFVPYGIRIIADKSQLPCNH